MPVGVVQVRAELVPSDEALGQLPQFGLQEGDERRPVNALAACAQGSHEFAQSSVRERAGGLRRRALARRHRQQQRRQSEAEPSDPDILKVLVQVVEIGIRDADEQMRSGHEVFKEADGVSPAGAFVDAEQRQRSRCFGHGRGPQQKGRALRNVHHHTGQHGAAQDMRGGGDSGCVESRPRLGPDVCAHAADLLGQPLAFSAERRGNPPVDRRQQADGRPPRCDAGLSALRRDQLVLGGDHAVREKRLAFSGD